MTDYYTAYEVLEKYRKVRGADSLKRDIAQLLRDGFITAEANVTFKARGATPNEAWELRPAEINKEEFVPVSKALWRYAGHRTRGMMNAWKWNRGDFVVISNAKPKTYRFFSGVRFLKAEIDAEFASQSEPPALAPRSNAGRKPKTDEWDKLWIILIGLAKAGKLNVSNFPTMHSLEKNLDTKVGLTSTTLCRKFDNVWNDIMRHDPNENVLQIIQSLT